MKIFALHLLLVAGAVCLLPLAVFGEDLFQQGVKAYNAKDYRTACSKLELFLKNKPDDVNALYYDALCWYQLRNSETAAQRYKRIIQLAPGSAAAGYARTALSAMATSTTAAPASQRGATKSTAGSAVNSAPGSTATGPAAASESAEPDDMSSLPDTASFYFTKESSGHMSVNVRINGHQVPAYFDTGAGAFFYRDQLVAAGVDCNKAKSAGYARGWAGTPVPVYAMPAEVKLGSLTRMITITIEESSTGIAKNLIGQNIISGYQYEIDDKGGRVNLRKTIASAEQKVDPLYDVPCKLVNSKDIITIEINGRTVPAFIDTGSAFTIVSAKVAESVGIESTGTQMMTGVGGNLAMGVGTARIRLGPINKEFTLRIGGSAGCCIGQDFMEGWRFKTDREHGLLRFFH